MRGPVSCHSRYQSRESSLILTVALDPWFAFLPTQDGVFMLLFLIPESAAVNTQFNNFKTLLLLLAFVARPLEN